MIQAGGAGPQNSATEGERLDARPPAILFYGVVIGQIAEAEYGLS